jgi:LAO/AO transport system kinase
MPDAGSAMHVRITDVPGVGRSTTSEALGMYLIERGHRVAVLVVDPSSTRTGGSILGDKTRMARLAVHPDGYIRSSPTSGTLSGVAKARRPAPGVEVRGAAITSPEAFNARWGQDRAHPPFGPFHAL